MPANPLERLARLQALGADPPAQAAHTRELLGRERNAQTALAALAGRDLPGGKPQPAQS